MDGLVNYMYELLIKEGVTTLGIMGLGIIIFTLLYLNKGIPFVRELIESVVIEAEKEFNSGEGQLKLNYAIDKLRAKLPSVLRIFVSRSVLVTLIENALNKLSKTFDLEKEVDIKGNDSVFKGDKIKLEVNKKDVLIGINTEGSEVTKVSTSEVYGAVKISTDWRDKPNTSIELGVKKKL